MEKWEYWTGVLYANIENPGVREFLQRRWPDWKPEKFVPQAMIPELNTFGEKGWELVHMQPVAGVGASADIHFQGQAYKWSNAYFCVFKRRIQE